MNEKAKKNLEEGFLRTQKKYQNGEALSEEEITTSLDIIFNSRFNAIDSLKADEHRANSIDGKDDIRYGESFKNIMAGLGINHRCAFEAMRELGWYVGEKKSKMWSVEGCKIAYGDKKHIHVDENPALFRFEDGKCYVDTLSVRYSWFIVKVLDKTKEMFGHARFNDVIKKKHTLLGVDNQIFIFENHEELGYILYAKSGNKIEYRKDIQYDRE